MRNIGAIRGIVLFVVASLVAPVPAASAASVTVTETCNVQVTFKATVPDSVEKGKVFSVTGISIQPKNTYGFNVTSSVFDMSATNTSSTAYSQNFYATDPSPTKGYNTYVGYYPNWTLDASGPVGSAVTIKLKRTVTVIQGYGGSPVTCNFTKTLASVPIVATSPGSAASQPPATSTQPAPAKSQPTQTVTATTTPTASKSPTAAPSAAQQTDAPTASSGSATAATDNKSGASEEPVSVVPLNIAVTDSSGKPVEGAEVTLDSTKKLLTDKLGRVVFSNVLTGKHALLISYKDKKMTSEVRLSISDVGQVKNIVLPPSSPLVNPYVIIGAAMAGIAAVAGLGAFIVKRRRRAEQGADSAAAPAITIPRILDGTAVPAPESGTITHIPAIQVHEPAVATVTPAPWELPVAAVPSPATPPASAVSSDMPEPSGQPMPPLVTNQAQYAAPQSLPLHR